MNQTGIIIAPKANESIPSGVGYKPFVVRAFIFNVMNIDKREYAKIHQWLAKNYGKADHCDKCTKPTRRFQWALKKGCEYDYNVNNFIQLCTSCHKLYDMTEVFINKCKERTRLNIPDPLASHLTGYKGLRAGLNPSAKKIKSISVTGEVELFDSAIDACNKYGGCATSISSCLTGHKKTYYGKRWEYQ
jgi:hypothetical protein